MLTMDKEAPVVSVEIPYVIEEEKEKDDKVNETQDAKEDENVTYTSPRLFRKSLIFKTWKLFKEKDEESQPKLNRPFKEK